MARQIDILMRAKDYLRRLHDGVDPLSGVGLPDFSAARDAGVHKLFFFCSINLEYAIEHDRIETRPAFSVSPEQAKLLRPMDGSAGLSEFAGHINRAVDLRQCRGLDKFILGSWLVRRGYQRKDESGNWVLTELGRKIGLSTGSGGEVRLDISAQQFVIERLRDLSWHARSYALKESGRKVQIKDARIIKGNIAALRRLSGGLHPYEDAMLDERDPLTQERLKKCFDYTAWVLERSVKAGFFTAKAPFTLPRERWTQIAVSPEPVSLVEFVRRVNELLSSPEDVRKLEPGIVVDYLVDKGLLQRVPDDTGIMRSIPTAGGNALGISTAEGTDTFGRPYTAVLYSAGAQRYMAEQLGGIIELAAGKG